MTRQCLSRRIGEIGLLRSELLAWEVERNTQTAKVPRITASDCKKLLSASCFFVPVRFAAVVFVPAVFFPAVFPDAVVFFFVLLPAKMKAPYLKIRAKTLIK